MSNEPDLEDEDLTLPKHLSDLVEKRRQKYWLMEDPPDEAQFKLTELFKGLIKRKKKKKSTGVIL